MGEQAAATMEAGEALARSFCRLGVADRAELVARMRDALGPALAPDVAAFYLDMNDWNLPAAVGFYLDFSCSPIQNTIVNTAPDPPVCTTPEPIPLSFGPGMSLLAVQPDETVSIRPGVNLEWAWSVMNNGDSSWPQGCALRAAVGAPEAFTISTSPISPLPPGNVERLHVNFTAPVTSGMHCQQYRLCTPEGLPFGESLWISIIVEAENQPIVQQPADSAMDYNMC